MPFLDDVDSPEVLLAWQHPGALGKSRPYRDRRQLMTILGGWHGRLRRTRSSPTGCGGSACFCHSPLTMR